MKNLESQRNPLDLLADEFTDRCRQGESPSIEEYAARYPDLADQIHRLFPSIAMMEQLGAVEQSQRRLAQGHASADHRCLERIGDYHIIRETGRGGMGIVYEAVQESLGRRVAVKVLARQALLDEKHLRRFRREAKTAANLHHTNIVPVFGVGEQDGYHYYVMQFIQGVGLDEVIAELKKTQPASSPTAGRLEPNGGRSSHASSIARALQDGTFESQGGRSTEPPVASAAAETDRGSAPTLAATSVEDVRLLADQESLPSPPQSSPEIQPRELANQLGSDYWHSVARVGLQVADALQYAHSQGTYHRDIKPGNLLLDAEGVVWVADFGLAKALEHDDVSRTGDVVGTLRYMAPEQFAGQADHRSDIYSLGLTIYELVALRPAFDDGSRGHLLLSKHKKPDLVRPRKIHPQIPRDLETIILKACAHEPAQRYQSAAQLAADLQCFLEDRPIRARRSTSLERLARWCRRNPALAGLSSVALLLLVLVAVSTSIGYVRTQAAFARESQQREVAESERQKAEMTLGISLEALDRVYRRFAPDRMIQQRGLTVEDEDGEQYEVLSQPALSRETATLLEDILSFYDRFAQQDTTNQHLRAEAAKANRRVGDIQQRLGAYDRAQSAYQRAIAKYQELESESNNQKSYSTELARIHNELGNVFQVQQQGREAHAAYQAALELLRSVDNPSRDTKFELARTYYFLGKRRLPGPGGAPPEGPRGPHRGAPDRPPRRNPFPFAGPPPGPGRPPGRPHNAAPRGNSLWLDRSIELLIELDKDQQDHPEYRYLLALCHRERGPHGSDLSEAIKILTELRDQYPAVADYRYELSETYASIDIPRLAPEDWDDAAERLQEALKIAKQLVSEHPNVTEYAHALAHTNHKLAGVLLRQALDLEGPDRDSALKEAEQYCDEAVRIQSLLVSKNPTATFHIVWLAKMHQSRAEILRDRGNWQQAYVSLEVSIAELEGLLAQDSQHWFVHRSLSEQYRALSDVLHQLGKPQAAQRARAQALRHRQPGPRGPGRQPGRAGAGPRSPAR